MWGYGHKRGGETHGARRQGLKEVTLASRASSALTPILTPLTLISRTQLEGGLKCTVSRRVVAICTRDGVTLEAVSLCLSTTSRSLSPFPQYCGLAENRHPQEEAWTQTSLPFA